MSRNLTRRAALAGSVALPLAPAAAMATDQFGQLDEPANATDAAWAELQAANGAYLAAYERWDAWDDWLRAQIGNEPVPFIDTDPSDYHRRHRAWEERRAQYPENPHEHPAGGEPRERLWTARDALVRAPVATMTDLERKLSVAFHVEDDPAEEAFARTILDGVRAMLGRSVA